MKEATYDQLTPEQKATLPSLQAIAALNPREQQNARYLVDADGVAGYRLAEMFNGSEPMKWGVVLNYETGLPCADQDAFAEAAPLKVRTSKKPTGKTQLAEVALMSMGSRMVPRALIFPSPLNPRKSFDQDYLKQLAETLKNQGVLNDLIVRPRSAELGTFEIVAGECRWRSSGLVGIAELPVKIRELSDKEVLELMLVENMRRKDLSIVEESDAFNQAMLQKNEDGSPVYASVAEFAAKIGENVDYVKQRIRLVKLPAAGRLALANGDLSFRTARVICGVPASLTAKALDIAMRPEKHGVWMHEQRMLNSDELQSHLRNHVLRELRDTPFQQNDAKLLPVVTDETSGERQRGGACTDCPWNTANQPSEDGEAKAQRGRRGGEGKWCLNPECFGKKVEIHTAAALVRATEEGCKILSPEESAKILHDDGLVRYGKPFVNLDEKPDYNERNDKIAEKQLPTWGKIVTGKASAKIVSGHNEAGDAETSEVIGAVEVPKIVAVTPAGHVVKLAEKSVAVAAAQKLQTAHFLNLSSGGGRSLMQDDHAERQKKEREEQKLRGEVSFAVMEQLVAAVPRMFAPVDGSAEFFDWLLAVAIWHGGGDSHQFVAKRRGLPNSEPSKEITALAKKATSREKLALALEVLIARLVKFNGVSEPLFKRLCGFYDVDAGKIEKEIRAAAKMKKLEKKAKEKAKVKKPSKAEKSERFPHKKGTLVWYEGKQYAVHGSMGNAIHLVWPGADSGPVIDRKEWPKITLEKPVDELSADHLSIARTLRASGKAKSAPGLMDAMEIDVTLAGKLWDRLIDEEHDAKAEKSPAAPPAPKKKVARKAARKGGAK